MRGDLVVELEVGQGYKKETLTTFSLTAGHQPPVTDARLRSSGAKASAGAWLPHGPVHSAAIAFLPRLQ